MKQLVDKWLKADFDQKIFQGKLGLKVGVDVDNKAGCSMLRNTLELAACIDKKVNNLAVLDYIYKNPSISAFATLVTQVQYLRSQMTAQQEAFRNFC